MRRREFLRLALLLAALVPLGFTAAAQAEPYRISGPHVHENLAVYFVHGASAGGQVPLTLQEAMAKGRVKVHETGSVNELSIENLGNVEVFVQSGDIVKGGQQDRVLSVSLVLPPRSGRVPIASFCVEQGRWAARGKEDIKMFSSSAQAMPSRQAKRAIIVSSIAEAAPAAPPSTGGARPLAVDPHGSPRAYLRPALPASPQQSVWQGVSDAQARLSRSVGAPMAAPQSATSRQLTVENAMLN